MALAYDARRSTRDIDAVFQPHGIVLDEARPACLPPRRRPPRSVPPPLSPPAGGAARPAVTGFRGRRPALGVGSDKQERRWEWPGREGWRSLTIAAKPLPAVVIVRERVLCAGAALCSSPARPCYHLTSADGHWARWGGAKDSSLVKDDDSRPG
jgi:hypothetical protein